MPRIITSNCLWNDTELTGSITYTTGASDNSWRIWTAGFLDGHDAATNLTDVEVVWPEWVNQQAGLWTTAAGSATGVSQAQLGAQANYNQAFYANAQQQAAANQQAVANSLGGGGLGGGIMAGMGNLLTATQEQILGRMNRLGTRIQQRDEQEAAYEARLSAELAERKARIEAANERATALLLMTLDKDQAKEYAKSRSFIVHTPDRKRRYQVKYGVAGNIVLLNDKDVAVAKFCIHPQGTAADGHALEELPTPDVMLAQALLLQTDEKQFLSIANKTVLVAA